MTLVRQMYRVESSRLPGWDYRASGFYFVTMCTKRREQWFGDVVDGQMVLSAIGDVVAAEWRRIPIWRRDVELDEWAIMPNHMHAIIVLKERPSVETPQQIRHVDLPSNGTSQEDRRFPGENQRGVSTLSRLTAGSLGAIIGQFKSRSTKRIWREVSRSFAWQPRFYDHIVRDEDSLNKIRQYIVDNTLKWELDKDNVENLYM